VNQQLNTIQTAHAAQAAEAVQAVQAVQAVHVAHAAQAEQAAQASQVAQAAQVASSRTGTRSSTSSVGSPSTSGICSFARSSHINYSTKAGAEVAKRATSKLSVDHDLDQEHLNTFLEALQSRAIQQVWYAGSFLCHAEWKQA
jgi:hypothetical protein